MTPQGRIDSAAYLPVRWASGVGSGCERRKAIEKWAKTTGDRSLIADLQVLLWALRETGPDASDYEVGVDPLTREPDSGHALQRRWRSTRVTPFNRGDTQGGLGKPPAPGQELDAWNQANLASRIIGVAATQRILRLTGYGRTVHTRPFRRMVSPSRGEPEAVQGITSANP